MSSHWPKICLRSGRLGSAVISRCRFPIIHDDYFLCSAKKIGTIATWQMIRSEEAGNVAIPAAKSAAIRSTELCAWRECRLASPSFLDRPGVVKQREGGVTWQEPQQQRRKDESAMVSGTGSPRGSARTAGARVAGDAGISRARRVGECSNSGRGAGQLIGGCPGDTWPMRDFSLSSGPSGYGTSCARRFGTRSAAGAGKGNGDDMAGFQPTSEAGLEEMTERTRTLAEGILSGSQMHLSRAITLCESWRVDDRAQGTALLQHLMSTSEAVRNRKMFRIGLTGPPGAGKSSLIERFGMCAIKHGHKVAVLAVDPSSDVSGGSILGDKTRMEELARDPNAFVRPSPSRGLVGGIALNTADAAVLCEAAGFGMLMVETVGGGQSDTAVAELVDMLVLVLPPAGGDELQGLKKGIVEVADLLVVNKADGETAKAAAATVREYKSALHFLRPSSATWMPPVIACSTRTREGIEDLLKSSLDFQAKMTESGELEARRTEQSRKLMWRNVRHMIADRLRRDAYLRKLADDMGARVKNKVLAPRAAATTITHSFFQRIVAS